MGSSKAMDFQSNTIKTQQTADRRRKIAALIPVLPKVGVNGFAELSSDPLTKLLRYIDPTLTPKSVRSQTRRIALSRELMLASARFGIYPALARTQDLAANNALGSEFKALRETAAPCIPALGARMRPQARAIREQRGNEIPRPTKQAEHRSAAATGYETG